MCIGAQTDPAAAPPAVGYHRLARSLLRCLEAIVMFPSLPPFLAVFVCMLFFGRPAVRVRPSAYGRRRCEQLRSRKWRSQLLFERSLSLSFLRQPPLFFADRPIEFPGRIVTWAGRHLAAGGIEKGRKEGRVLSGSKVICSFMRTNPLICPRDE